MSHSPRALGPLLGSLLLAILFSCATSKQAPEPSRGLSHIARTGEIRIGTSGEQPPLTMTARSGELIGLDVAFANVLAQAMGVEPKLVRLPFGQLLDALDAGDIDLVMSGMTITPERSRRATFVGPYYISGKTILTRSEVLAAAEIPEDLDSPDLRFAALQGSTSEAFAQRALSQATLVTTEQLEDAIAKVLSGEVDALVADRDTCDFAVLRHPDSGLLAAEATFTVEPMGIAVDADDPRLANLVQTYLTALMDSGALEKARGFWFKDPSWVKDLR
ncbi:MAG: transporter substrate-binding domain-containing protein [Myxococcota bacterium]